ncbi:hypothetical protein PF001_g32292, partial [Phytophthora fragariae]
QDPKWRTTGKIVANGLKLSRKCATLYGQRAGAKMSSGRDACRRASGAKSTVAEAVATAAVATAAVAQIARWGAVRGRSYGAAASRRAWRPGRRGGFDFDVFGGGGGLGGASSNTGDEVVGLAHARAVGGGGVSGGGVFGGGGFVALFDRRLVRSGDNHGGVAVPVALK